MAVPLCVDCRFYRKQDICLSPKASSRNVVYGTAQCHIERLKGSYCGPAGLDFELSSLRSKVRRVIEIVRE